MAVPDAAILLAFACGSLCLDSRHSIGRPHASRRHRNRVVSEGDELVVSLKERIVGRVALDNIVDIVTDTQVVASGEQITDEKADDVMSTLGGLEPLEDFDDPGFS